MAKQPSKRAKRSAKSADSPTLSFQVALVDARRPETGDIRSVLEGLSPERRKVVELGYACIDRIGNSVILTIVQSAIENGLFSGLTVPAVPRGRA